MFGEKGKMGGAGQTAMENVTIYCPIRTMYFNNVTINVIRQIFPPLFNPPSRSYFDHKFIEPPYLAFLIFVPFDPSLWSHFPHVIIPHILWR